MSIPDQPTGPPSIAELESDIQLTREQLAETVSALGARLDVTSRVRQAAATHRTALLAGGAAAGTIAVLLLWRWKH